MLHPQPRRHKHFTHADTPTRGTHRSLSEPDALMLTCSVPTRISGYDVMPAVLVSVMTRDVRDRIFALTVPDDAT